jgi:nitrogen fixation negative regulator NifL
MRETVNGAIHQLEGPVNLIAAAGGAMKRRRALSGQTEEDLSLAAAEEALQAGQSALENLTNSLPKAVKEDKRPVNLNQIIREALAMETQKLLTLGILVQWEPALRLPMIYGQERRLRSMVKQLIDNAIEAIADHKRAQRDITLITKENNGLLEFAIVDSGPGIDPQIRFKVFQPFFSSKKARKGFRGMGLPMVQEIVTDHSGNVFVDADQVEGCRIVVQLPVNTFA